MRWKTAQSCLLALVCVFERQQHVQAAYSPAVVRIDTGSSSGPFTDGGGNVWSSDSNNNGGVQLNMSSILFKAIMAILSKLYTSFLRQQ